MASGNGLGAVRRVHRSRLPLWTRPFSPLWTAALGGLCLVLVLVRNPVAAVLLALLIPAGLFIYASAVPSRLPGGRQWIAVCEGGLVVAHEYRPVRAVVWADVREWREAPTMPGPETSGVLVVEGEGEGAEIAIGTVSGRGDLVRALVTRAPAPRNHWRGVRVAAAAIVLAGVLGWLAKWQFLPRHEDTLPSVDKLGAACGTPGVAYDSAATYGSSLPRPLVIYQETDGDYYRYPLAETASASSAINPQTSDMVQLIACVRRDNDFGRTTNTKCDYAYNNGLGTISNAGRMPDRTLYIETAHYVVNIYELRTHHKVASRQIDGDDMACPGSILLSEGTIYSRISNETLHRVLDPLTRS
ncbi:hypothetical protein [Streptomyces herbicida]|uniref:hypothetical protein n=1 Tax=Streptomyces herbicida TaxID=3065675 RepID=UPI002930BFC3|nr:hypothetical protein [Streptomyces sp. NEAU-HV9]